MLHPSIATPILNPLTTIIQSNILHPCICSKAKRRIKRLENLKESNNLCIICELYAYGAMLHHFAWSGRGHKHQIPKMYDEVFPFGYNYTKVRLDFRD